MVQENSKHLIYLNHRQVKFQAVFQMPRKYVNLSHKEQMKICREVNMYKMKEMEVHSSSIGNIHVLSFLPKIK